MKGYFTETILAESHAVGTALGIFWAIFLFVFCFLLVHFLVRPDRQKPPKQEPKPPAPPVQEPKEPPQAVYYIVEKKSKRSKTTYSKPKRIHFE